jgi:peroxiredoxin
MAVALAAVMACTSQTPPETEPDGQAAGSGSPSSYPRPEDIVFQDDVETNVEVPDGLDDLAFSDTSGQRVALEDYLGKKNVVLVFTKGFSGMLCPFCKTQTSRLVANYDKFEQADAEVLVVYPGTRDHLEEFIDAARTSGKKQVDAVPFPILLDEDFAATNFFKIRSSLAIPSTFIIDKSGNVRLAHVSADMTADRPSVQAMLGVLESANGT